MRCRWFESRFRSAIKDDAGVALASVVAVSAILFVLLTTLLGLVSYRTLQTGHYVDRAKAMQVADAGVSEYLYQVGRNFNYADTVPRLPATGVASMPDGSTWSVETTRATVAGVPYQLVLTAVGTLPNGYSRTVKMVVRFPTLADYALLVNTSQDIGVGAVFNGKFHANGNSYNQGVIMGDASATGKFTWPGNKIDHFKANVYDQNANLEVKFSDVLQDIANMKTRAISTNTYYDLSGTSYGYLAIINGSQLTVSKITGINPIKARTAADNTAHPFTPYPDPVLGALTTTPVGTINLPGDAVVFFDDNVWVSGSYACALTIATGTGKDIYLYDNVSLTAPNSNYTLGLVSSRNVIFPYWSDLMPASTTIRAAVLAQSGTLVAQATPPSGTLQQWYWNTSSSPAKWSLQSRTAAKKTTVTFDGSVGMSGNSGLSAGFDNRVFNYDNRLTTMPPPMYPRDASKSPSVGQWNESSGS
jgi:hypothetical protein